MPLKNEIVSCDEYHQFHSHSPHLKSKKKIFFYPLTSEILNPKKKLLKYIYIFFCPPTLDFR